MLNISDTAFTVAEITSDLKNLGISASIETYPPQLYYIIWFLNAGDLNYYKLASQYGNISWLYLRVKENENNV